MLDLNKRETYVHIIQVTALDRSIAYTILGKIQTVEQHIADNEAYMRSGSRKVTCV